MPDSPASDRSRQYRESKTPRNLIAALLACLGLIAVVYIVLPSTGDPVVPDVDVAQIAADAQPTTTMRLAVPAVPEGWTANSANWSSSASDAGSEWRVSYITADNRSIVLRQAYSPSGSWAFATMQNRNPTGTITIAGRSWDEYDYSGSADQVPYGIVTVFDESVFDDDVALALYGNASSDEFAAVARAAVASITDPDE